ncbi:MAG: extracellular solute-binding protein [Mesorhizobium sp.]|nr:MAG: extracellular solute-binding protein [Mesorhizobium sp.]
MKIMRNLVVVAGLLVATVAAKAQDQALIDAAKAEGQVVWYSGLIVRQVVTPIKDAFEKKYGITVNFVSMASQEAALRILNEGRANNIQGDVFDGTAPLSAAMEAGLVEQYVPQEAANYPAELKDPNGYWTGQIVQVTAPAINTGLVSAADAPKTFEDLLDPKWKGKMAWSSSEEIAGPPRLHWQRAELHGRRERHGLSGEAVAATDRQRAQQHAGGARPRHCRAVSAGAVDPELPCRHQCSAGRSGRMAQAGILRLHFRHRADAEERSTSQRG